MFLVATHAAIPRNKKSTSEKDFWLNPDNIQLDEDIKLMKNVKMNALATSSIVLDLKNKKVIKNRLGDGDYEVVVNYFMENYPELKAQFQAETS
jgi:hypothetical protein